MNEDKDPVDTSTPEKSEDQPSGDDILRRMLETPPKPHKKIKDDKN